MENKKKLIHQLLNFEKPFSVHVVGCGGVSMYSIALYLKKLGHIVSGSDEKKSAYTSFLEENGINVKYKQTKENLSGCNMVIYSFAVDNGEEVLYAKKNNIPCFSRPEVLGEILKQYNTSICVAGAHGKTTTTALIYAILKDASLNVDLHLGGNLSNNFNCNNFSIKNKDYVVCEACEYKDAFLKLTPTISVVTNIAPEHLDYFKTFSNVVKSFNKFGSSANMLICSNLHKLKNKNKIFFAINCTKNIKKSCKTDKKPTFYASNIKMQKDGTYKFKCYKDNLFYGDFHINLIGKHNVENSVCAIALADYLKIDKKTIQKSLSTFCGVGRRFEILNKEKFIVCDYAHHPDEISAVITETKKFYKNKLLIVFQPHTYTRTKNLINKFVECFKNLENVVIYKTFSAREKYDKQGSALTLSKKIGDNVSYFNSEDKLIKYIKQKIHIGYGVLFLGAGNIYEIAKNVNKLC